MQAAAVFAGAGDIVEGVVRVNDRIATANPDYRAETPDPGTSNAPYRVFNIGNHHPVQLMDFIGANGRALGRTAEMNLLPM